MCSGKKLSLRRVLAFVASSQRDDRLWLRRRRPRGLQYRVLVGLDCSRSMQQLSAAGSALEAVVLLSQAFNSLQVRGPQGNYLLMRLCMFLHAHPSLRAFESELLSCWARVAGGCLTRKIYAREGTCSRLRRTKAPNDALL